VETKEHAQWIVENPKSQAPNPKQIQITNFKISGDKVRFEDWDFDIRYCLVFRIWGLEFIPRDVEQIL
jgi:hypothetical protein